MQQAVHRVQLLPERERDAALEALKHQLRHLDPGPAPALTDAQRREQQAREAEEAREDAALADQRRHEMDRAKREVARQVQVAGERALSKLQEHTSHLITRLHTKANDQMRDVAKTSGVEFGDGFEVVTANLDERRKALETQRDELQSRIREVDDALQRQKDSMRYSRYGTGHGTSPEFSSPRGVWHRGLSHECARRIYRADSSLMDLKLAVLREADQYARYGGHKTVQRLVSRVVQVCVARIFPWS